MADHIKTGGRERVEKLLAEPNATLHGVAKEIAPYYAVSMNSVARAIEKAGVFKVPPRINCNPAIGPAATTFDKAELFEHIDSQYEDLHDRLVRLQATVDDLCRSFDVKPTL